MEPTGTNSPDGADTQDAAGTQDATSSAVVTDNPARSRFELYVDGDLAGFVNYRLRDHVIDLIHTEVDPKFQGSGLASLLAQATLDQASQRQLAVLPSCPYIRSWIRRHPSYADLVPEDRRSSFGL